MERALPRTRGAGFYGERVKAVRYLIQRCLKVPASCPASHDVYQFGVYTGRSMRAISYEREARHISWHVMWGFDSFEGLPIENATDSGSDNIFYHRTKRAMWRGGMYNAADMFGEHSWPRLERTLTEYINSSLPVELVRGYFESSLTAVLAARARPALYIDIDSDLYSSSVLALAWLFSNRLVRNGTVISYDDIHAGGGYNGGEGLAHVQAMRRYEVVAVEIAPKCCFEVRGYRGMPLDHVDPRT